MTSQPASTTVAYIETFDARELAKSICAIANSQGGQVVVGQSGPSKPRDLPGIGPAVFGVNPTDIEEFRSSLSKYFMTPFPEFEVSYPPNESAQVAVVQVKKHEGRDKIALVDRSISTRRGDQNESHMFRAKKEEEATGETARDQTSVDQESDDRISRFNLALQKGENEKIEFVKSVKDSDFRQTISAFANSSGGTIYVGVKELDTGWSVVGTTSREVRRYLKELKQHFSDPLPTVEHKTLETEGPRGVGRKDHPIVEVNVKPRQSGAFVSLTDGSAYQRSGKKTVRMNLEFSEKDRPRNQDAEKAEIIRVLLNSSSDVVDLASLQRQTGFDLDRIEGHVRLFEREGKLRKVTRTSSGVHVQLDAGNRIELETLLEELGPSNDSQSAQAESDIEISHKAEVSVEKTDESEKGSSKGLESRLESPLRDHFSPRTFEVLDSAGIQNVGELVSYKIDQLFEIRGFDEENLKEVRDVLDRLQLSLGLEIPDRAPTERSASENESTPSVEVDEPIQIGGKPDFRRSASSEELCLDIDKHAEALAAFLDSAREDLCFGLFGHWGRGKTKLIQETSELLEVRKYAVVNFKAWKYRTGHRTQSFHKYGNCF